MFIIIRVREKRKKNELKRKKEGHIHKSKYKLSQPVVCHAIRSLIPKSKIVSIFNTLNIISVLLILHLRV